MMYFVCDIYFSIYYTVSLWSICLEYLLYGEICEKNEMEIKLFLFQKQDFVMEVYVLRVKLSIFAFLNGTIYFHLAGRVA